MRKLIVISLLAIIIYACNNGNSDKQTSSGSVVYDPEEEGEKIPTPGGDAPSYDPNRGKGKFTQVDLSNKLDVNLATTGEKIYGVKCSGCHKLTDEKLVGPGWKGVTDRRSSEWIMNFITNTSVMLDSDLVAQAMMATCLVRMPNQSLSDDEAREVLEFQRKNDGKN